MSSLLEDYRVTVEKLRRSDTMTSIELAGLPRTGKSSFAEALRALLAECGASVANAPTDTWECPIRNKWTLDFELWTITSLVHAWVDAKNRGSDFFIADRGWLDALIWTRLKLKARVLSPTQAKTLRSWITAEGIWPTQLVAITFTSKDPRRLIARRDATQLLPSSSRAASTAYLESLDQAMAVEIKNAKGRRVIVRSVSLAGERIHASLLAAANELKAGLEELITYKKAL